MDVMDTNAINELFAQLPSEFDTTLSPSYPPMAMDRSAMDGSSCSKSVWDALQLDAIEPLLLDLPVDTSSSAYSNHPSMDYDQFFPESLGPKVTAIFEPMYDVGSPHTKEGSAYSPRHDQRSNLSSYAPTKLARCNNNKSRVIRKKCPVFPESSTPLSELKSYSSTSLSSKSSTVKSDGSYPGTFASDPGQCDVSDTGYSTSTEREDRTIQQFITEVLKPRKKLYLSDQDEESEGSTSMSPIRPCGSPVPPLPATTTKAALKIEIPTRYVKKITDLDRKILKLQAERAKLLEKGQSKLDDFDNSFENRRGSVDAKSSVQVHYYAVGIPELDGACYDEGNFLLSSIGGINNDYRLAIERMCEACNEKKCGENISACLLHMRTLLVAQQSLKLHQMESGLYQILVQPYNPKLMGQELALALAATNDLLRIVQQIVGSSVIVENRLKLVIDTIYQSVQSCEATCDHLGILDERKVQIKNVLEGNQIALETALRAWPRSCTAAKNTIQAITNSIHSVCSTM